MSALGLAALGLGLRLGLTRSLVAGAVEWEEGISKVTAEARYLDIPSYLVDTTASRALHRFHVSPMRPTEALRVEWDRTVSWWWAGWNAARLEAEGT